MLQEPQGLQFISAVGAFEENEVNDHVSELRVGSSGGLDGRGRLRLEGLQTPSQCIPPEPGALSGIFPAGV